MMRWALLLLTFGFGCAVASVPIDSGTMMNGPSGGSTTGGSGGGGGSGPPIPDGPWINSTANLANLDSICGALRWMAAKPDEDKLVAGVALKGMWASTDGGA